MRVLKLFDVGLGVFGLLFGAVFGSLFVGGGALAVYHALTGVTGTTTSALVVRAGFVGAGVVSILMGLSFVVRAVLDFLRTIVGFALSEFLARKLR